MLQAFEACSTQKELSQNGLVICGFLPERTASPPGFALVTPAARNVFCAETTSLQRPHSLVSKHTFKMLIELQVITSVKGYNLTSSAVTKVFSAYFLECHLLCR